MSNPCRLAWADAVENVASARLMSHVFSQPNPKSRGWLVPGKAAAEATPQCNSVCVETDSGEAYQTIADYIPT